MLEAYAVLAILLAAVVLFFTEWLPMDLVALLVLGTLALTGLVTPDQALAGFSNPAVVTVWAMFILSSGLVKTGVAEVIGQTSLRFAGAGETRMTVTVMLTSAVLSAFMNNIGVAALMLPVVLAMARKAGHSPSRLLMPLAFGSLLGGLTTLIGTPPNLLASQALRDHGLPRFGMFDFTPVGGVVMLSGIAFVAVAARRILPERDPAREPHGNGSEDLSQLYALDERSAVLRVPADALIAGRTLRKSRLGAATGLNVYAVVRAGSVMLAPSADERLQPQDRLLVEGKLERLADFRAWSELTVEPREAQFSELTSADIALADLRIAPRSELVGLSVGTADFRRRFGVVVIALRQDDRVLYKHLTGAPLGAGHRLLVQGHREQLDELRRSAAFDEVREVDEEEVFGAFRLRGRIFSVRLPDDSDLAGRSMASSRLGDALGLAVLGLIRGGRPSLMPDPEEPLQGGDRLLVRGHPEDLDIFRGLQQLDIETEAAPELASLEADGTGPMEVMLSPRTGLAGKTVREIAFRERYGLLVLALLREGRVYRSGLREMTLRFGDALLLLGPREKQVLLADDADFLPLTRPGSAPPRTGRRALAAAIMAAVVLPVIFGWTPIALSAVAGATLMVLSGCLTLDEAYRAIEWRSVFLIAGMLPLGTAMEQSGAAAWVAEGVVEMTVPFGPWGVLIGLYLMTALATSIIPTAALVVLMAPIVFDTAASTGVSPTSMMMAVAVAASASFTSPISHPANVLVMGPGGYRFVDYVKLGVPLTLVVMVIALLLLPWVWPLR